MKINQFSFNIKRSNRSLISRILEFWLNEIASTENGTQEFPEASIFEKTGHSFEGLSLESGKENVGQINA